METFYEVGFCADGSTYFFHSKENAISFIWEAYGDNFPNVAEDVEKQDKDQLMREGFIEDYAWIEKVNFEDD